MRRLWTLPELLANTTQTASGCMEWTGPRNEQGYGTVCHDGRSIGAHRLAVQIMAGRPLDRADYACHHCDNPPCINPSHLYLGNAASNTEDRNARRRFLSPKAPPREKKPRVKPTGPLAEYLAKERVSQRDFARLCGIDEGQFSRYVNGKRRPGLQTAIAIEEFTNGAVPLSSWMKEAA